MNGERSITRPPRGPRPIKGTHRGLRVSVDGVDLVTRVMTPADGPAVREMHGRCSPETIRLRYFGPLPRLSDKVIELFTNPARGVTLVTHEAGGGPIIAMTNLMNMPEEGEAEMAFLIEDGWQGRGLGTVLMRHVLSLAAARRFAELTASVYATNRRMLGLLRNAGAVVSPMTGMIVDVRLPLLPAPVLVPPVATNCA